MKFLNPLGLLLGLLLPIIILLYFKKKQIIEKKISNVFIWDEVIKEVEGVKSRKINKYLILIIQLIIGSLIVISFSNPIWMKAFKGDVITIGLDCSIKMKTVENGKTHFQLAKEEINNYIEKLENNKRINIVLLKGKSTIYLKDSKKEEVQKVINKINCTNESLNIDYASKILESLSGEKIIITDKDLALVDRILKVGREFENIGITNVNYDYYENTILCRIKNYGKKEKTAIVSIYDDKGKKDLKSVKILPNDENDIIFQNIENKKLLKLKIENEDMLQEDNKFVLALTEKYKKKVLLIGENIFLENAISSIPYIHFEKVNNIDEIKNDYDLYIVNKEIDREIKKKIDIKIDQQVGKSVDKGIDEEMNNGVDQEINIQKRLRNYGIWYLNPKSSMLGGTTKKISKLKAIESPFSKDINMKQVYIEKTPILKEKNKYKIVLEADGKPVMIYGNENNQKRIYSTIDFNRTNLVMMPHFPILIKNTIDYFLDGDKINYPKNPPNKLVVGEDKQIKKGKIIKSKSFIIRFKEILIVIALLFMVLEWEVYRRAS